MPCQPGASSVALWCWVGIAPDLFRTLILERLVCRCLFVKSDASVDCWSTVTDFNAKLVDMNVNVPAVDARAVEVLASGLPLFPARADKERKFFEPFHGDRCRLVVVALEIGGRWSLEVVDFIERLASPRRATQFATVSFSVLAPLDSHNRHFMRTVVCQLIRGPVFSPSRTSRR